MTTKHRFRNRFRLELRERDHGPAHVHLVGGGFDVMIELQSLVTHGAWPSELRLEVLQWVEANRDSLLEEWKKWHR